MEVRPLARTLLHALIALPLALLGWAAVVCGLVAGGALSVTPAGPWIIALTARGALALGGLQRFLSSTLLDTRIDPPPRRAEPGAFGWRRAVLGDRAAWRAVGCALAAPLTAVLPSAVAAAGCAYGALLTLHPLLRRWNYRTVREAGGSTRRVSLEIGGVQFDSWPMWLVVVPAGITLLAVTPWLVRRALVPHRWLLRSLLGPDAAGQRIRTLEETRAQAVDDAAATLRRIERDLHDGTQARLVGLGMHLTLIAELVAADADRDRVLAVVETARSNAKQAVADLRVLVKGIHPPVLDQGLDTALATLAADSVLPVTVTTDIAERPAPALESIAYFCAAELLTNAVKHSAASEVRVAVRAADGVLRLSVRDDGQGGATVGAGSGLTGLRGRARTVDGTLTCESPAGGPTVVTVVLPYRRAPQR
ncbi:sensor histidine kinase [Streptomyces sp. B1I3]|uniref:sensor histidine kinase n=1 Tax=Streptomyces sp. B1I3 TaxID=3042264 RepID=UPI002782635D|nr:sensor histidine kinase [Streptomyces sp. B1I3]MDQ0793933.1 signal transduction histidine kinase [Streptomyces sp. B1I3]